MRQIWKRRPADRATRRPPEEESIQVSLTLTPRRVPSRALTSPLILIYGFAGLVSIGTLFLLMPFTHHGGGVTPFVSALFTATSAVTMTGLTVQETATYWTRAGQVLIMAMMFLGGLGFMTSATFLLVLVGQRVTLSQRLVMKESLGVSQLGGLVRLTVRIALVAVAIQFAGFIALLVRFAALFPTPEAIWQAAFHTVSGFNNAGFVALKESNGLSAYRSDEFVLSTIAVLVFLGGISYFVLVDVVRFRRFSLLSLNSKLVLSMTALLIVIGAVFFLASEYQNEGTLGPLPVDEKVTTSLFQSINSRSAGFATVDFGRTHQHTNFFYTSLMFIGGASASVAGGIKVNSFAVVLIAVLSTLRGRSHATAFGREIPEAQIQRAMSIGALATAFVFLVALLLTFSEGGLPFIDLLFESVSAFGTTGLSTGLTPDLSNWGRLILVLTMFIGRMGPLTIGLALVATGSREIYRYAQERVTIG